MYKSLQIITHNIMYTYIIYKFKVIENLVLLFIYIINTEKKIKKKYNYNIVYLHVKRFDPNVYWALVKYMVDRRVRCVKAQYQQF